MIIDNDSGFVPSHDELGAFVSIGNVDQGKPLSESVSNYINGTDLVAWQVGYVSKLFKSLEIYNVGNNVLDRLHIYAGLTEISSLKSLFGNFIATKISTPLFESGVGFIHNGSSSINTNYIPSNGVRFQPDDYIVFGSVALPNNVTCVLFGTTSNSLSRSYFVFQANTGSISLSSLGSQDNSVFTRVNEQDYALRRQSNANYLAYQNALSVLVSKTRTHDRPTIPHYDGGRNVDGAISNNIPNGAVSRYSGNGSGSTDWPLLRQIINDWINNIPSK